MTLDVLQELDYLKYAEFYGEVKFSLLDQKYPFWANSV